MERGADPIITTLTIVQQLMSPYLQVLAKVGDNQVLLQSIKGSAYYDAFGDRASAWERRLTDLDEVKPMITRFIYLPTHTSYQGAAQHEHGPTKVGEPGAVPRTDEIETKHWWFQLQRGGDAEPFVLDDENKLLGFSTH